jgi:hypothetical protein
MDAANGTALATVATPPAQVVAIRMLRRARSTSGLSLMGNLLLEGTCSKARQYTKNILPEPNFSTQPDDFDGFYQYASEMSASRHATPGYANPSGTPFRQ